VNTSSEWLTWKLEECCDILDSKRIPVNSEDREKRIGNIPYYGANGLQGYINDFIFDEPLILIAEDGGRFDEFATQPIAYRISGKSWVNNHAHVLRAKNGFSQDAIFYALEHKDIQSCIVGGTRAKLNQGALRSITIQLPEYKSEQSKIAEVISTVDRAIEQTEGLIAKQQRIKIGLMQDILTHGIDEHGNLRSEETHEFKDSPLGRIPVEWEVLTTGEVTKSLVPGRDKPELDRGGVPWITIPDLIELYISTAKSGLSLSQQSIRAANARLMPTGTVLMSCVGEFGIAAIVEVDVVANQQFHGFVCSDRIMREWLAFAIINAGYRIDKMTTQTTIKYLNKSGCEPILISLPSLREQKKAIAVLMNIQNISSQYEAGLVKLRYNNVDQFDCGDTIIPRPVRISLRFAPKTGCVCSGISLTIKCG
jgi:type I restriction enzyme S subunit